MKRLIFIIVFLLQALDVQAGDKELFHQVYSLILSEYIEDVRLLDFFKPVFKAVEKEDKDIHIIQEKNSVTVYYKGRIHKVYSHPREDKNPLKWAEYTDFLLKEIKKISPELENKDFELAEVMLYNGTQEFDKNMHYYPVLEIGEQQEKIQPYHASLQDDKILYIRLGTINDYTTQAFHKTIEKYPDPQGIILDLRGNKGGYLRQALEITETFLSKKIMIYTQGKEAGKRNIYRASEEEKYKEIPLVVLVDSKTASAAEVIALALQKNKRATIVGAQTFGKGTVQNIYKLNNEGHIALTTERFFGFEDFSIEGVGMRPDICSEYFDENTDIKDIIQSGDAFVCPQLNRQSTFDLDVAIQVLKQKMTKN